MKQLRPLLFLSLALQVSQSWSASTSCTQLAHELLSTVFTRSSKDYQFYVLQIKDILPDPVRHEVYHGSSIEIPQGMTRDNAAFSSFLSNSILHDLKSNDPNKIQRAMGALPDYFNNAFTYFNPHAAGSLIYNADLIFPRLKEIEKMSSEPELAQTASEILKRWSPSPY
jgi:hypothetical protein